MLLSKDKFEELKKVLNTNIKILGEIDNHVSLDITDLFNLSIQQNCADKLELILCKNNTNNKMEKFSASFVCIIDKKRHLITSATGASGKEALNNLFGQELISTDFKDIEKVFKHEKPGLIINPDQDGGLYCWVGIAKEFDVNHDCGGGIITSVGTDDLKIENFHFEQIIEDVHNKFLDLSLNRLNVWGKKGRPYYSFKGVDLSPK